MLSFIGSYCSWTEGVVGRVQMLKMATDFCSTIYITGSKSKERGHAATSITQCAERILNKFAKAINETFV